MTDCKFESLSFNIMWYQLKNSSNKIDNKMLKILIIKITTNNALDTALFSVKNIITVKCNYE